MKLAPALAIAFASLAVAAYAEQNQARFVFRSGPGVTLDADNDGWIARAEAASAADRIFDQMDANNDGRLTSEDHAAHDFDLSVAPVLAGEAFDQEDCTETVESEGRERRITIVCEDGESGQQRTERRVIIRREGEAGGGRETEREVEREVRDAEREVRDAEREAHDAEREVRDAEREAHDARREARRMEREVIVVQGGGGAWVGVAPTAPTPPAPPHPPMFMMLFASSEEADLNGDGTLTREEFRAQHLRFFDASDANGDGRVRSGAPPPLPPEPPAPPAAPAPPARR